MNNIFYADGTVVLVGYEALLQALTDTLSEGSQKMGLKINIVKTKSMVFTRGLQEQIAHASVRGVAL